MPPSSSPPSSRRTPSATSALRHDDHDAWNELFQSLSPMLRRVVARYGLARDDVDDVLQDCWVCLLASSRALREPEAVPGWLATVARRQAIEARRRRLREFPVACPRGDDRTDVACPHVAVVEAVRAREVRAAVGRLPDRQRRVIGLLITVPDHSYARLARTLEMPIGSIGPTRERGLQRLRSDGPLLAAIAA